MLIRFSCVIRVIKRLVLILVISGALADGAAASSNPVEDFFRRLGNSIAHPQKKSRPRRSTNKSANSKATPAPSPSADVSASPSVGPPNQQNIRSGSAVPASKGAKRDVPYGIPVPGRKGFVTSPFAPDAGYVDVRSFPPGTEVKDPYSGKVFRAP